MKGLVSFLKLGPKKKDQTVAFSPKNSGRKMLQLTSNPPTDNATAALISRVLMCPDTLSAIFKYLNQDGSLEAAEIAQYAAVCKVWREVAAELPLLVRFTAAMKPHQLEALLTTKQQIGALSFYDTEPRAAMVLQHLPFCRKQGKSLKVLWDIDCVNPISGSPVPLQAYSNLRKLFISCMRRQAEALNTYFDSSVVAHMEKLETLSLRGFTSMNFCHLPLSLKMLHVGPGTLVDEGVDGEVNGHAHDPMTAASWEERFALGLSLRHEQPETTLESFLIRKLQRARAFPEQLRLQQVVINCGRGAFLEEPLKRYLGIAQHLTVFGRKLVVYDQPQPYEELRTHLLNSQVKQLTLEFDRVMLCRLDHGTHIRLNCSGVTAAELARQLSIGLGLNAAFSFSCQQGSMYEQSVCATRVPS